MLKFPETIFPLINQTPLPECFALWDTLKCTILQLTRFPKTRVSAGPRFSTAPLFESRIVWLHFWISGGHGHLSEYISLFTFSHNWNILPRLCHCEVLRVAVGGNELDIFLYAYGCNIPKCASGLNNLWMFSFLSLPMFTFLNFHQTITCLLLAFCLKWQMRMERGGGGFHWFLFTKHTHTHTHKN